jgi:hypothetical protein
VVDTYSGSASSYVLNIASGGCASSDGGDGGDDEPSIGDTCGTGVVYDCNMYCSSSAYLGDGFCDDGAAYTEDFDCSEFSWDEGDCY